MASETKLVRLKPYNKKKGHVIRRYTYRGIRFNGERGWYRVKKEVADYLATVHQSPGDKDTPAAFDIANPDEARAIDEREAEAKRPTTPAEQATDVSEARPNDLTTADLPETSRRKRSRKR